VNKNNLVLCIKNLHPLFRFVHSKIWITIYRKKHILDFWSRDTFLDALIEITLNSSVILKSLPLWTAKVIYILFGSALFTLGVFF
jgi:hypothetical protein